MGKSHGACPLGPGPDPSQDPFNPWPGRCGAGKLEEAMEMLTGLEKQTRTGCDTHSTSRVLVTIVTLLYEAQDWTQLNDRIQDLVKKRSQLKQAVAKMIAKCCTFLDS